MKEKLLSIKYIAHRGYYDNKIPENSIKAFKNAIKYNYPIELDVRLSKDNNIVVFHDNNTKRMTGINNFIDNMTYNEINKLHLLDSNEKIPLFKNVLKLINGKVPIIIEIKNNTINHTLESNLLELLKYYKGFYLIKSFNPFSIKYIKNKNKNIITGLLYSCKRKKNIFLFNNIKLMLLYSKPDFISCNINCIPIKYINKIKNKKVVFGYTIRSNNDLEYAKKYCDGFICENIDKLEL